MTRDLTDGILARITDEQALSLEQAAIWIPSIIFEEQRIADLFAMDSEHLAAVVARSGQNFTYLSGFA